MLAIYNCLRAKPVELQFLYSFRTLFINFLESFAKNWKKYLLNWHTTLNPIFRNAPLQVQDITEVNFDHG